ncbi:hypothetical protein ACIQV2_10945 [Streptomyces globosus]|uniref:hypothetical protein n=1 Tax=Streptomyces globosus TaxID=68209 RepID=UPI0038144C6D
MSSSAFGTEDGGDGPQAAQSAPLPAPDVHAADTAPSRTDHTAFRDGVMQLDADTAAPAGAGGSAKAAAGAAARAAAAAAPQGEGWKLSGATKWLATGYTIKFYDQKSADWLGPYVKATAADLQRITNLPVKVDTKPVGWEYSPPPRAR